MISCFDYPIFPREQGSADDAGFRACARESVKARVQTDGRGKDVLGAHDPAPKDDFLGMDVLLDIIKEEVQ